MATGDYCTRPELIEWANAQQQVAVGILDRAITACSGGINDYCQRHFDQRTEARQFDACDPYLLNLGEFNDVVAVTAVATDENRDGTWETVWSASDYQVGPVDAPTRGRPYGRLRAVGARCWPRRWTDRDREGLIRVTGTWGWSAIPSGVNQACIIHAARIFRRKDSPEGVAGWNEFGAIRVGRTDPDVIAFLEPFRRTAVLVA